MWFWLITIAIIIAGASGGVINALLSDSGFIAPGWYEEAGNRIWKPGVLGNMLLGAAAAFISWGLYGPFSAFVLMPPDLTTKATLTLSALVGAFLVGIGGARVITSEVEKNVLSKTAVQAANLGANAEVAGEIATASTPSDALNAVSEAQQAQNGESSSFVR
jgi:hypothetical protein